MPSLRSREPEPTPDEVAAAQRRLRSALAPPPAAAAAPPPAAAAPPPPVAVAAPRHASACVCAGSPSVAAEVGAPTSTGVRNGWVPVPPPELAATVRLPPVLDHPPPAAPGPDPAADVPLLRPEAADADAHRYERVAATVRASLVEGRLAPERLPLAGLVLLGVLALAGGLLVVHLARPGVAQPVAVAETAAAGAVSAGGSASPAPPAVAAAPPSGAAGAASVATPSAELVVSVGGLVARPGLVRLPPGARVADALEAAGGAADGVDLSGLNLARPLTDGEHVAVGVPAPVEPVPGAAGSPAGSATASPSGLVDLNRATPADLEALPGVGPVLAERILAWREEHGGFRSVEDLQDVKGVGPATFAELAPLVAVG